MFHILQSIYGTCAICADCMVEYAWYIFKYQSYDEYIDRLSQKLILRNILFIKLFQGLAANAYLTDATTECLMQYTANTPYTEDDIDYPVLLAAVNKYNIRLSNNEQPINSGMISVIYRGVIRDTGHDVVIKIRKKNIRERIEKGCTMMYHLYTIARVMLYPFTNGVLLMVLQSLVKSSEYLVDQCDFAEESANTQQMRKELVGLPQFVVPVVYSGDEPSFIIMEYLDGTRFADIPETEYSVYAQSLISYVVFIVLNCSRMHLDMHYGNLIFMTHNNVPRIGLIDFGIITQLDKPLKKSLIKTLELFYRCSVGKQGKFDMIKLANTMFEPPLTDIMIVGKRDKICNIIMEYTNGIFAGVFNDKVLGDTVLRISKVTGVPCRFNVNVGRVFMGITILNRVILRFINWDKKRYIELLMLSIDDISKQAFVRNL